MNITTRRHGMELLRDRDNVISVTGSSVALISSFSSVAFGSMVYIFQRRS